MNRIRASTSDWLVLGPGWVLAPLLVLAGGRRPRRRWRSAQRRQAAPRRSGVAAAAAAGRAARAAGDRRPVRARAWPRPRRPCRSARPWWARSPACSGVLAAFTFAAGVSDAAAHPARFGQTWQLGTFFGYGGQDFGPASQVLRAVAADRDVTGVDDARIGGAQSGQVSVESFTYDAGGGQAGPGGPDRRADAGRASEIVLGPDHGQANARGHRRPRPADRRRGAADLHGDRHRLRAARAAQRLRRRRLADPGRI